jgi:hypothetical protein
MRHIYSSASYLCVWLGDAKDDSDMVLDRINDMFDNDGPGFSGLGFDSRDWQALMKLLARPYWSRV